MKRWWFRAALLGGALALAGCGAPGSGGDQATGAGSADAAGARSPYDSGPRAGESPVVTHLAEQGEKLFRDKGCSACHAFGRRVSGPDLQGVSMRRTSAWMEQQILHPDRMIKEDPIARELFAQYSLQMPNQGLTADEARAVIEFLKHQDRETGGSH